MLMSIARMMLIAVCAMVAPLNVRAEDQSKQGDPMLRLSIEEGLFQGMTPSLLEAAKKKNVPDKVVVKFVRCYARWMAGKVDASDKSLWTNSPETRAKIDNQIMMGMALALARGSDPVANACPKEAEAFRSAMY